MTMPKTITVFDANDRYTKAGLDLAARIHPLVELQVNFLLKQGYTLRTVMVPASVPTVLAADFGVNDPEVFKALWMLEVMDTCLSRVLFKNN